MMEIISKPITSTIIMFDQSIGELQEADGKLLGIDLLPEARSTLESIVSTGIDTFLIVPTDLELAALENFNWLDGLTVAVVSSSIHFDNGNNSFATLTHMDPATAFISSDRRLRGEAVRKGMYAASHIALLPMMQSGAVQKRYMLLDQKMS